MAQSLLLEAALEGVMKCGGAKPGDKTMIDAIAPAAAKARESVDLSLTEAGKEASKGMSAHFGRAKHDDGVGHCHGQYERLLLTQ